MTLLPDLQAMLGRMPRELRAWTLAHAEEANERFNRRRLLGWLSEYDRVVVAFSGGKDSMASVLSLLDLGLDPARIELWHHRIDPPGQPFMDWPCTPAYCRLVADTLGLPLYFSWKEGGYEGELLREDRPTAPTRFEVPGGAVLSVGGRGQPGTRLRFPQTSSDLKVRWCSAYLKIDVAARVFSNDPRFEEGRFLLVTGERAEESPARSRYAELEPHKTTNRRRKVDQYRIVHGWPERQVWQIIEKARIRPHPAYRLGFGRLSCFACIFGNPDQWRSVAELSPPMFHYIAARERASGFTIRRDGSVEQAAERGRPLMPAGSEALGRLAMREDYVEAVRLGDTEVWEIPAGAFRKSGGPT